MSVVFADTFYWIALADFADSAHEKALEITAKRGASSIVTTDEVLAEYMNFFSDASAAMRRQVARSVHLLVTESKAGIRVMPQSRSSFLAGVVLYEARPDKGYSLTDCISMETMRREGITDALTNDRHFEQEGFRALFRD